MEEIYSLDDLPIGLWGVCDELNDISFIPTPEGRVPLVNQELVDGTGYSRGELIGENPLKYFEESEIAGAASVIQQALELGRSTVQLTITTKGGTEIPSEFSMKLPSDSEGKPIDLAGVGRNISARKRRERQLSRKIDMFKVLERTLIYNLWAPLNSIQGHLDLYRNTPATKCT